MAESNGISRRNFLGAAATAAAGFSIVPRHVVARSGRTPPSEQVTIAAIGCGTQGLWELGWLLNDDRVRIVAVCDPNKFSTNYLDWTPQRVRNGIRSTLGDKNWGAKLDGIPGGRDVGQEFVDSYYAKHSRSGRFRGCAAYEDFRDLLANEADVDAVKIMTPDHLHAFIAMAAMKRGIHTVTHKPIGNRMSEALAAIEMAEETGLVTHLLAWKDIPQYRLIRHWIEDGAIGELHEIHNWTNRPVWKQWSAYPTERPPVPKGFNWQLWLGPVPDRPYHPDLTHNVFRGWYDFGGGSIADMGHYSLFPLFETLGITRSPTAAKAYGTTTRKLDKNVFRWEAEDVAFPLSSMVRFEFPKQDMLPAFSLYWYDGGMKPFAPPELIGDGRDIAEEGMMLVGDKAKIICGFEGQTPHIIPRQVMRRYHGPHTVDKDEPMTEWSTSWIDSIRHKQQTPGSFIRARTVTETINLAAVALRAGKRVEYDPETMRITNDSDANKYLYREEYRPGWELPGKSSNA